MSLARTARLFTTTRFAAGPAVRSAQFVRFKSDDTADIPTENIPAQNPKFLKRTTETQGPSVVPDVAGTQHGGEEGLHTRPATDHGTSAYSPVTATPTDRGPEDPLAANVISGAPVELTQRTVRIYKPAKNATQSGHWNGRQWKMDWDVLTRGHRWENALMGWQSSADFMQGTHLFFKTKEDAIAYAERQGYDWFVSEPNQREFRSKSYAANFLHSPKKLKIVRTK